MILMNSLRRGLNPPESFYKYVNLLDIYDNIAIGIDGSWTAGFRIKGFDYYLSPDEFVNDAARAGDLLLNLLDDNIGLQWVCRISDKNEEFISSYRDSSVPPESFKYIKEKKIKSLKEKKIKNIQINLFCSINTLNLNNNNIGFIDKTINFMAGVFPFKLSSPINANSRKSSKEDAEFMVNKMNVLENNLSFIASRLNIEIKRMNSVELTEYYYNELNPSRSKAVGPPLREDSAVEATLRSRLVYSHAEIKRDYLYIDGYFYKFINMHGFPFNINSFGITPLLNISENDFFPYDIQTAFFIPEQEKTIDKIQSDRNIKASLTEAVGGGYTDYKGAGITKQLDDFLQTVSESRKKIIELSLCVRLKSRDLEELNIMSAKVLESFKNFNAMEGIIDDMEHHNLFFSFLPGQYRFNRRFKASISQPAAAFFPLHQSFAGTEKCAIPLINDKGEAVRLDLYNNALPSKHGIVFGKTRSGKGFMLNGFLSNFFVSGDDYHIIGVDIGGTYKKFCRIFGGDYIELELDGNYSINPFPQKKYIVKNIMGEEVFDPDIMIFLIGIIGLMAEPEKTLSPNDRTIIGRAIQASYDFIEDENDMPVISDVNNVLFEYNEARDESDKKRAMELGKNLFQWTDVSSPYSHILNRKEGVDSSNRIIVFDLQKLKGHEELQKVIFAIIKNLSFKKMYDKSAKVFFFYDECWEFMNDPKISELIMHLYKTSAKWGSMVWSVTQEPSDLIKTGSIGKSIIENSSVKIFCQLDGGTSSEDLVSCGLNSKEIEIVKNLKVVKGHFAEYFLKFGKNSSVIRNTPDPFEYWLCCKSSEDEEIERLIEKENPGACLKDRLNILAERYPFGPYGVRS